MKKKYKCHKCENSYDSKFWFDFHLKKHSKKWSISTAIIFTIALISLFNFPMFNGYSILDHLAGPEINIEPLYPPGNNAITISYQNVGRTSLTGVYIKYHAYVPEFNFSTTEKVALIKTQTLVPEEKSSFYIETNFIEQDCELVQEPPEIKMYYDLSNGKCYYKLLTKLSNKNCIAGKINITFFSNEFKEGIVISKNYPFSLDFNKLYIWRQSDNESCANYEELDIKENLIETGKRILEGWTDLIGDNYALSKKYCQEGLMPPKWCVENNL